MNKSLKTTLIIAAIIAVIVAVYFFIQRNRSKDQEYQKRYNDLYNWLKNSQNQEATDWREAIRERAEKNDQSFEERLKMEVGYSVTNEMQQEGLM